MSATNLPSVLKQRNVILLVLSTVVLLPLCSLKSLNALAPFSLLGLSATLYSAFFMALRYFDGSYAPNGKFFVSLSSAMKPVFNKQLNAFGNPLIVVLLSMLGSSFVAHTNAPKFYSELKDKSRTRFNLVVNVGFSFATVMFVFMMSMGFLTFGGSSSGFILNNYAPNDILAGFARLAVGLTLITGYPFNFTALRDGIMDLFKMDHISRSKYLSIITIGLLGVVTGLSMVLKDVRFIVGITGALFSSLLMFVVPAMINLNNNKSKSIQAQIGYQELSSSEVVLNKGMIILGVFMSILGVGVSVLQQFGKM